MDALRRRLAGTVVARNDADYPAARDSAVWNRLVPPRGPDAIVRVAHVDDVCEAVRFARAARLPVAVRGGGHSWCGMPLRDGGLLLDLSALTAIEIDAAARTASVQPIVRGGELARALAPLGLAFPVGHCPTVPLSGYLLAGGLGWNPGGWGPGCLSIRAIDVVTADGRLVTASDTEHPDLFWAARGAGPGFFGVVVRYHLALHPLPRAITSTTVVQPLDRAPAVVAAVAAAARRLPSCVELAIFLSATPAGGHACIVSGTAFVDDPAAAGAALAPLQADAIVRDALVCEALQPTPLPALLDASSAGFPDAHRYLADAAWTDAPPGDVAAALLPAFVTPPPSQRSLAILGLKTGDDAPAPPDMAFAPGGASIVLAYAIWDDERHDAANHAWHGATVDAVAPFASGHYVGEAELVSRPGRAERCFTAAAWRRLAALRRQWDPDGVFHAWVPPAPGATP